MINLMSHDWIQDRPHDRPLLTSWLTSWPISWLSPWFTPWPNPWLILLLTSLPTPWPSPWTTQNQGKISFEDFGHLATLVEAIGLATVWNNVGRQILATFQLPAFSINLGGMLLLPPGWKPPLFPILELLVLNALVLNWENRNRFWWIYTLFVDTQFTEWQNVLYGQNKEVRCCVF